MELLPITADSLDDEALAELIEFRRTTLKHHTDEGNKTQAVLHNMVLVALLELQERRKADSAEPIGCIVESVYEGANCRDIDYYESDLKGLPIGTKVYAAPQPAPVVNDGLYKLANHVASSKNGLPEEWQDWAEELESEIRRAAMLKGNVQ